MPVLEFPYIGYHMPPTAPYPNGTVAHRPFALATIMASSGTQQRCLVCLDSGADQCVFPLSFAKLLGLDVLTMPNSQSPGTSASTPSADWIAASRVRRSICFFPISGVKTAASPTSVAWCDCASEALYLADKACYSAKRRGRIRLAVSP